MKTFGNDGRDGPDRRLGRRGMGGPLGAVLFAVALVVFLPGSAGAAALYPPNTGSANRTATGFELTGTVYNYGGSGASTTYHFEYGTTTGYGSSVPMPDADAGSGLATRVSQQITGLVPDTTYHWRLVSDNSAEGTGTSPDATFSTATTTMPTPTITPGEGGTPLYPGEGSTGSAAALEPTVAGHGPRRVAKALRSNGRRLLTDTQGRTLYSLSVERKGRFVCTKMSGCTEIWHPLTLADGVVPKGPVPLGTSRRPEGLLQVTYRGHPLYTFGADRRSGQTNGEGLKDVGTWHAVVLRSKGSR
jgi:predicted lipoprotein with Yx(FWY)xxD motif